MAEGDVNLHQVSLLRLVAELQVLALHRVTNEPQPAAFFEFDGMITAIALTTFHPEWVAAAWLQLPADIRRGAEEDAQTLVEALPIDGSSYQSWEAELLSAAPPGATPNLDALLVPLTAEEAALRSRPGKQRLREVKG